MTRTALKDRKLPAYTKGEEIFNMVSHIVGGALGIAALVLCVVFSYIQGSPFKIVGSFIYGFSIVVLYANSSIYHGLSPKADIAKKVMQVIDHCAIFILIGGTGLGKTHLSLAIANKAIERGHGVIYGSAPNMFGMLEREHFGRQYNSDRTYEQELLETDLLIIDDLGVEFSTQFTVSCVYNIINSRMLSRKPTIISTNLTARELEEKYTQRITSRIIGNFISLKFVGKDIRQLRSY